MRRQPDYYAVLKVARTATRQEISRAYRALMRIHHPDVPGGSGSAAAGDGTDSGGADSLPEIMEAFAVLRDPMTRAEYDRTLSAPNTYRSGARSVPVRRVQSEQPPLLRVRPVRWERGPWAGT
ncbi:J domain-containing protein [Arthrobacter sp. 24S4-2]|uniref:J domain-containing protein n=1 Tax=Arthrobacter sp. 24S4-2 TaxID=2575374 RepID=UPI0010C7BC2F|nr:DnaJ domain-containing protein [Arthrobacter sp. 24S4-2]QCO99847.1 J domain-containing protein [Arthrobacter sp. 24S4-2]